MCLSVFVSVYTLETKRPKISQPNLADSYYVGNSTSPFILQVKRSKIKVTESKRSIFNSVLCISFVVELRLTKI